MSEDTKFKVGRRYRFTRTYEGKAVSADACRPDPCVRLEDEKGGLTGYLDTNRYDVEDLGPALEAGFYLDSGDRMWRHTKSGNWVNRTFGSTRTRPRFPIRRVTLGDELIRE